MPKITEHYLIVCAETLQDAIDELTNLAEKYGYNTPIDGDYNGPFIMVLDEDES